MKKVEATSSRQVALFQVFGLVSFGAMFASVAMIIIKLV
jgi:hypothetical protein